MELSVKQRQVVEATDKKILCLAASGSGKTRVLTERVRHLVENCHIPPSQIIAISFTNLAAEEMKERLGNSSKGVFIGTIHSLANSILMKNGIDMSAEIVRGEFDKIIDRVMTLPEEKFPHVRFLLIDEFQDTSERDYNFFEKIQADNFFVVGDERQVIYGFRGATDTYLKNLFYDKTCKTYQLNENFRTPPNIVYFAEDLLGSMKKISLKTHPMKASNGHLEESSTFLDAIEEIKWSKDYGNWFILCRFNAEITEASKILKRKDIPFIAFKKSDFDTVEMNKILKSNVVKVLTIHSSKGLESKHVIVTGAKTFSEEERKVAYVAATRAEQDLYWCPSICKRKPRVTARDFVRQNDNIFEKGFNSMISFE